MLPGYKSKFFWAGGMRKYVMPFSDIKKNNFSLKDPKNLDLAFMNFY